MSVSKTNTNQGIQNKQTKKDQEVATQGCELVHYEWRNTITHKKKKSPSFSVILIDFEFQTPYFEAWREGEEGEYYINFCFLKKISLSFINYVGEQQSRMSGLTNFATDLKLFKTTQRVTIKSLYPVFLNPKNRFLFTQWSIHTEFQSQYPQVE